VINASRFWLTVARQTFKWLTQRYGTGSAATI